MKIIHIAPTPFFSNRGCHIRIRNEVEGLLKKNIDVILCTYGLGSDVAHLPIKRIFSIPGYTQTSAGFSPYKFPADVLLFFLVLFTTWKEKPDVLHGHLHEGALIGWAVKVILFWRKIPLLMDTQGSLSGELSAYGVFKSMPLILRGFYFLEKKICHFPQRILCSSLKSVDFLVKQCGLQKDRIVLFEDVVPDSFFDKPNSSRLFEKYEIPADKKLIIYTGSLLLGKGISHLLEAIRILLSKETDLFFVFVGYPTEIVEKYSQDNDLSDSILIVGEVAYDELALWLSLADLAVDPKEDESGEASGKILHYMACGLPVVCFGTGNNRKYLGSNAFFAEPGSASDLANMIEKGLQETRVAEEYGRLGREKIIAEYSLHAASENLIRYYQELLTP